jgi:hypothetical protein
LKCAMQGCQNTAKSGRSTCEECLKPYERNGTIVHPPDISESTYQEMASFFLKARINQERRAQSAAAEENQN